MRRLGYPQSSVFDTKLGDLRHTPEGRGEIRRGMR